jgi:hypothetical protein
MSRRIHAKGDEQMTPGAAAVQDEMVSALRGSVRALHGYAAANEKITRAMLKNHEVLRANVEWISRFLETGKVDEARAFVKLALEDWPDVATLAQPSALRPLWCYLGGGS